jgi:transposase
MKVLIIFCFIGVNWSITTTNNNQAFYSQASWGRLEMKPHEPKKKPGTKQERKRRGETKGNKKPNKKGEKIIKR